MDMLSDGELFRLQQEAIERAKETARRSPSYSGSQHNTILQKENQSESPIKKITEIINLKGNDNLLIIGVLLLLLSDGCDDKLLLFALVFLLLKG